VGDAQLADGAVFPYPRWSPSTMEQLERVIGGQINADADGY
jgi:hypothetical protein